MAKRGAILRLPHRAHPRLPIPGGRRQGGQSGGVPRGSSAQSRPGPLSGPHALRPRPCSAFFSAPSRCCTPRSPTTTSATTSTRSSRYPGESSEESCDCRPLDPASDKRGRPPNRRTPLGGTHVFVLTCTRGGRQALGRLPGLGARLSPPSWHRPTRAPLPPPIIFAPPRPALPAPGAGLLPLQGHHAPGREAAQRACGRALRCAALWLSRRGAGRGGAGGGGSLRGRGMVWVVGGGIMHHRGGRASARGSQGAGGPAWGILPAAQGNRSFTGGAQSAGRRMNQGPGLALQVRALRRGAVLPLAPGVTPLPPPMGWISFSSSFHTCCALPLCRS